MWMGFLMNAYFICSQQHSSQLLSVVWRAMPIMSCAMMM